MFDIRIGTIIDAPGAEARMPILREAGFESFELNFPAWLANSDLAAIAPNFLKSAGDCPISTLGIYGNTLEDENLQSGIRNLIKYAHDFGCDTIGLFAGAVSGKGVQASIPLFKKVFSEFIDLAERYNVRLAIENCGCGWKTCVENIGYCEAAWELMFDAVNSPRLGLEWEPAHQLGQLVDVEAQLRRIAKKVFHIHGKDATVAKDILYARGIDGDRPWKWDRNPGFGDSNWANLFTILLQAGFSGSCDIEGYHDVVHYDDLDAIYKALMAVIKGGN
jgi:sugar phosphate isomerase/epimerase